MKNSKFLIIAVCAFFLIISLFKISDLPGEWFGDISNVHEYVTQILKGEWPFYFFQSPGPLYHYLITPIVLLYRNHGFETYKLASIIVSLLGIIGSFLMTKEIAGKKLALITASVMSFSFWYLIWSRLGNSQIVIPALASFMGLFTVRYIREDKFQDLFLGIITASFGWYTYPQTFIFPVIFLLFIIAHLIFKRKIRSHIKALGAVGVLIIITVIPFINIVRKDPGNFGPHGYVGAKWQSNFSLSPAQFVQKAVTNYSKTLLMFHAAGEKGFRTNVAGHPHLDTLSGIFMLLGILYFSKKGNRKWLFFILIMMFTLLSPSVVPSIPDVEIPSSSRVIAVVPFVYLLVGAGILWSVGFLNNFYKRYKNYRYFTGIIFSVVFAYITFANLKLYFMDYANGLPDRNLAPGKIIAGYLDKLPLNYSVYFASCCWGEWGEPEPKGIIYQLHKTGRSWDITKLYKNCDGIIYRPAVIVEKSAEDDFKCKSENEVINVNSDTGLYIARLIILQNKAD